MLTVLAKSNNNTHTFTWLFMLGSPSLKFYSLVGIFTLNLITFHRERHELVLSRLGL